MPKQPKRTRLKGLPADEQEDRRARMLSIALFGIIFMLTGAIYAVATHPAIVDFVHRLFPLRPLQDLVIGSQ